MQIEGTAKPVTVRIARKDERSTGITFRQDDATSGVIDRDARAGDAPRRHRARGMRVSRRRRRV
jgi:hypothetical protein